MRKKRIVLILTFGILMILKIISINASLGLTPAVLEVNFKANSSYLVNFQVLDADPNQKLIVTAAGDLVDYVKFDKRNLTGPESFTAYIDLPNTLQKYGKNTLLILVKEDSGGPGGFSTVLQVGARIYVNVPYPGQYGEINTFAVSDTNENESIYFYLELYNHGTDDLEPNTDFEVYSKDTLLDKYSIGSKSVPANTVGIFDKTIDVNKYKAGNYLAKAYVHLNDRNKTVITSNTTFRVGSLIVDIVNWTREVNISRINPFDIEIESKWNHDLKNVYAQVNVTNESGVQVDFFKTSPVDLNKWQKATLNGFFNAENLKEGKYKAYITLFYEDSKSSKSVDVNVIIPEIPQTKGILSTNLLIIGIISIIVIVVAIILIIYLIKKNGKRKTKPRK